MTDEGSGALMVAAQCGDREPYRRLLVHMRLQLVSYFERRLPPAMVENAVRTTLMAVHDKRHTFDPLEPFGPWLAAIAHYKWVDQLRAMRRLRVVTMDEDPLAGA
jgi:RNA polymerase sigma-70 factor (ECF subfamily)